MKLNIQLFAEQTILSNKQSTSGSPYVIYTVKVTPSNRTLNSVDLTVQISAHLKNDDSTLGTGNNYGIKGKLTVAGQEKWFDGGVGNGPIIKKTTESWSKKTVHTTTAYTYTVTGLSWDTTSLATTFYAIRTSDNTSNAGYLSTTNCTAITIEQAAAPSTITEIVGGGGTTDYAPSVKWTPKDSSFKFKLIYSYGSWANYNINDAPFIYPNTTSEHTYSSYTIQGSSVAPYMSSATADFTATLYTYDSSGNQIGSANSKTFKVTLNPNTYKPTASIGAFSDAGGIVPSSWGMFVAGKSKLSFSVSASASTGSSIPQTGYSTSVNGKTYTTTSITTDWLSSSGSANLTVTDSRGRIGTASSGYTVVAYATPDIDLTGYRAGSTGTASGEGQYYHYIISGHIQSCKNGSTEKNSVSEIKIGYRVAGSSSAFAYETISATMGSTSNNRVAFTAEDTVFGGNLSTANNYEIRVYLKDGLGVESSDSESVGAAFKLLSYTADGTGIAIGKKATTSNKVEVNMNTSVNGDLSATGHVDGADFRGGSVELSSTTPFIDFHYNNSTADYTSRIIESASGKLQMENNLIVNGELGTHNINNEMGNTNHKIVLGYAGHDSIDIYEYGGTINLIQSQSGTNNTIATISPGGSSINTYFTVNGTIQSNGSGRYITINPGNTAFTHYSTNVDNGHWFNKNVYVAGDIYKGPYYDQYVPDLSGYIPDVNEGASSYVDIGWCRICFGKVAINPTANQPTGTWVQFAQPFVRNPVVIATPDTSVPYTTLRGVGVSGTSTTGTNIYLTRTNTTKSLVYWIAIGPKW